MGVTQPNGCSGKLNIKVIVEPGEDGYVVAHVPYLKSCWSQGKTKEEALQNIREAIDLYLEQGPTDLGSVGLPSSPLPK
jgi:predicted RNase H-like HicB family nuclease